MVRPAAYALIVHDNAILLITNETSGRFYVPGGGLEVGESLHEAVVREVQEEAGIAIKVTRLLAAEEDFFYYDPTDTAYHGLLFYYQALPLTVVLPTDYAGTEGEGHPHWVPLHTLGPHLFHTHGDRLYRLIQSFATSD